MSTETKQPTKIQACKPQPKPKLPQTGCPIDESTIYDVVIVGTGISGIAAAYYLQKHLGKKAGGLNYVMLDKQSKLGGTWELFKYPGIRSDSDVFSFVFPFDRRSEKNSSGKKEPSFHTQYFGQRRFGTGDEILGYLNAQAKEHGIDQRMRFNVEVESASWRDEDRCWTLKTTESQTVRSKFFYLASGYYNYENPEWPHWEGEDEFLSNNKNSDSQQVATNPDEGNMIVHPQFWNPEWKYKGKRVVIIGSGATAVTLVPSMSQGPNAAHSVAMLQRTPSYMAPVKQHHEIIITFWAWFGYWLRLPWSWISMLTRWTFIFQGLGYYNGMRAFPNFFRKELLRRINAILGDRAKEPDMVKAFDPPYKPWDQRLCAMPDGDLIQAIKQGSAKEKRGAYIVTDTIKKFDANGIQLNSGGRLDADIVIVSTGLRIQSAGGIKVFVNGRQHKPCEGYVYHGVMLSDLPNLFLLSAGYLTASFALKSCLSAEFSAKMVKHCRDSDMAVVTPRAKDKSDAQSFFVELKMSAGYLERGDAELPKTGKKAPWRANQNYLVDFYHMNFAKMNDVKNLEFVKEEDTKKTK